MLEENTPIEDFRKEKPLPEIPRAIHFKEEKSFKLANGMTIILIENHQLPRVTAQLFVDRGIDNENDKAGLEQLTGRMLSCGTKYDIKSEWDTKIDYLGGSVNTSSIGGYASSLKKHFPKILSLFADAVQYPAFPINEFQNLKRQFLSNIMAQKSDAGDIMSNLTKKVIYPENHPYSEVLTEETIQNISIDDCISWYEINFRPEISYLIFEGDINLDEVTQLTYQYFGKWDRKGEVVRKKFEMFQNNQNDVSFVEKPGSVQSLIRIGYALDYTPYCRDMIAANLMNTILGGYFSSRLNMNLREERGFTYGISSVLNMDEHLGSFTTTVNVRNEVTSEAIRQILMEINRLRTEMVTENELEMVKNVVSGNFIRSIENPMVIARFALAKKKFNLEEDYFENQLIRINTVTCDDIFTMSKKYLREEGLHIMAVGNKDVVPQLAEYGTVSLFNYKGQKIDVLK